MLKASLLQTTQLGCVCPQRATRGNWAGLGVQNHCFPKPSLQLKKKWSFYFVFLHNCWTSLCCWAEPALLAGPWAIKAASWDLGSLGVVFLLWDLGRAFAAISRGTASDPKIFPVPRFPHCRARRMLFCLRNRPQNTVANPAQMLWWGTTEDVSKYHTPKGFIHILTQQSTSALKDRRGEPCLSSAWGWEGGCWSPRASAQPPWALLFPS